MKNIKSYTQTLNEAEGQNALNKKLMDAAEKGNTNIVADLLDMGAQVDARNPFGWTVLHWAATNGHTDTAMLLLDRGAQVDARNPFGWTVLHWAARNGKTDVSRLLLDRGAQVDARDEEGWAPLHYAALNGHTDIVRLLILRGADPLNAFDSPEEIIKFFNGDIDWMPEGPTKTKLKRMQRGKSAFGM